MNLMAGSFAHMANLLFPRGCAGCDKPDDVLCDACLASFDCELSQPLETAEMGRWFACGWYRGAARQSILAWKDHGDEECDRPFSDALCRLAERAGVIDAMDGVREICDTILVVPASSSIAFHASARTTAHDAAGKTVVGVSTVPDRFPRTGMRCVDEQRNQRQIRRDQGHGTEGATP